MSRFNHSIYYDKPFIKILFRIIEITTEKKHCNIQDYLLNNIGPAYFFFYDFFVKGSDYVQFFYSTRHFHNPDLLSDEKLTI